MDQQVLQGWHEDPFGVHERRYFSAGRPTRLVRDGDIEAYDEPHDWPADPAAGDAAAVFAPPGDMGDPAPLRRVTPPESGFGVPARRRRSGLAYTAVALVSAAAVVAVVAIVGLHSRNGGSNPAEPGPSGMSLAAFVSKSAKSTLAQKTADITLRGSIDVGGTKADIHGNGQVDLATDTMAMNISMTVAGSALIESEIATSKALYMRMTIDGQSLGQFFGGKHWLEAPLVGKPSVNPLQGSPTSYLQMLGQQGARVTPMGAHDVGGRLCNEYTVTPTKQSILAAAQREWARLGLSNSESAAVRQALENVTPPTITVWFDPKRNLACQLAVSMPFGTGIPTAAGSAPSSAAAEMLLTFTHYGVPVHITAPPQSDTISIAQAAGGI